MKLPGRSAHFTKNFSFIQMTPGSCAGILQLCSPSVPQVHSHRFIPTTATTIDADAPRGACCWSGWIISVCVFYKPGILHGSSRWPQRKAPLSPCAATQLSTAAGNMLADLTRRARAHTSKNTAQSLVCCCLCKEPCQNLTTSGLEQMLLSNQIFTEPLKGQRGKTFLVHFCNL